MKFLRKPQYAAVIAVVADILMLVAAVILDAVRERFPAEYTFNVDAISVSSTHPYDMFGIVAASVLVLAVVMSALVIIGGIVNGGKKAAPRITGGIVLLILSAGVIMFSYAVVKGRQPESTEFFAYTDDTLRIVIAEERYEDDLGMMKLFQVNEDTGDAELLTATDITTFANGATDRYNFSWLTEYALRVSFQDGINMRVLQIPIA